MKIFDALDRLSRNKDKNKNADLRGQNLLVLAPHADDEIFCVPHGKYFESKGYCITVLFLSGSVHRYLEAKNSCKILDWAYIDAKDLGQQYPDGLFHQNLPNFIKSLKNILNQYSIVLCPALEGGHQDHDSTFVACMIALSTQHHCEPLFYKTYTATGRWKFFEVFSKHDHYSAVKFIPYIALNRPFWGTRIVLAFHVYRSQWTSWIALLPAMIFSYISGSKDVLYSLGSLDYCTALACTLETNSSALYELHGKCTKHDWLSHVRSIILQSIEEASQCNLYKS